MKIYAGQSHFINEQEESTLCAESPKSLWALHLRDSRAKDGHHQANRAGSDSHCRHLWVLIFLFSVRHHGGLVKGVRAIRILPSQSLRAGVSCWMRCLAPYLQALLREGHLVGGKESVNSLRRSCPVVGYAAFLPPLGSPCRWSFIRTEKGSNDVRDFA
ncbi:hypothetical protein PGTUg99_036348 [Puccinia graminis f. sp. tritici]|uniref:Uncharacterized protein n=1 Tax=Puccinia graminis f. sp. tritici TaxID=56615 RepID=A0A5B0SFL8_PUCGR|nr:hypothetical protein PGTUg99_036348 [Puccinia graminis f. sp. tritici]